MKIVSTSPSPWSGILSSRLVGNAGAYVIGGFLIRGLAFLLLLLWARYLTPTEYGIVGIAVAYSGALATLLGMGLEGSLVRNYFDHSNDHEQRRHISSVTLFLIVVAGGFTLLLELIGPSLWSRFSGSPFAFRPYMSLSIWFAYMFAIVQTLSKIYQAQQKGGMYVAIMFSRFVLYFLLGLLVVVFLKLGAFGVLFAQLFSTGVAAVIVVFLVFREWFSRSLRQEYITSALKFGLPLVPHLFAAWGLNSIDRIILVRYVPLSEVGMYTLAYTLALSMQLLVSGMSQAISPHYYHLMSQTNDFGLRFIRIVNAYVVVAVGACLLGIIAGPFFALFFFQPDYADSVNYISPVLVGYLFFGYYLIVSMPIFFYKKTWAMPVISGIALFVNVVLNLLFIPLYGALASAWITAVTYFMMFVVAWSLGRRYQRLGLPFWHYAILTLLVFPAAYIEPELGSGDIGFRWIFALIGVLAVYLFMVVRLVLLRRSHVSLPNQIELTL